MKCWNSSTTKCWISAFNAQSSRGIIVAVQVGAVKIYVAASGGAQEKRKTEWNSAGTIKIDGFLSFTPPHHWMLMYFFAGFKKNSHSVYDQTQGTGAVFSWLYAISLFYVVFILLNKNVNKKWSDFWCFQSPKVMKKKKRGKNYHKFILGF